MISKIYKINYTNFYLTGGAYGIENIKLKLA